MPTPNWSHVLAMSLGVAKVTTVADQVMARVTQTEGGQPYLKSAFATLLSVCAGVYLGANGRERLLIASAIAGGAALVHDKTGASAPVAVINQRGPRPRSL